MALLERWGERLVSMGREWTGFERTCPGRGETAIGGRLAFAANAEPEDVARVLAVVPAWLRERTDLALAARRLSNGVQPRHQHVHRYRSEAHHEPTSE